MYVQREEDAEGIYHSSEHNEKNILMMRLSVTLRALARPGEQSAHTHSFYYIQLLSAQDFLLSL